MTASQHSFGAQTYGHGQAPDGKTFWYAVIAVVGCFLLFMAVVFIAYTPPNSVDASGQPEVVQARLDRLAELRAKEATAAEGYSWANQPKHIVRIPIERAVALLPAQLSEVSKPVSSAATVSVPETAQAEAVSAEGDAAPAETAVTSASAEKAE